MIGRDIQIAHEIQNSILPADSPEIDGVSLAIRYEPMTELRAFLRRANGRARHGGSAPG